MDSNNEGLFRNLHDSISETISNVEFNNFANLDNDSQRVSYVCSLAAVKNYNLGGEVKKNGKGAAFPVAKDAKLARELKADGNAAVGRGDWVQALTLYSNSLLNMPQEDEGASVVLANRSAALYHLERWEASLEDIARALELSYPDHLRYKVLERRARCLLALKRHQEAIEAFRQTISALDNAKLPSEKKQKMQTDAQIMTTIIGKGQQSKSKVIPPAQTTPPRPRLSGAANKNYPAASDAVEFAYKEEVGRFATAARDVSAGEVVLVERAYSAVLLPEYCATHCHHCFTKCSIPLACKTCPNVVFCSDKCLSDARIYHDYECPILPLMWMSGCSITCLVALRIITQNPLSYFRNLRPKLSDKPIGVYKSDDYVNVYNLIGHEDKRTKKDLLHRTEMAVFLLKLIELSGYFQERPIGAVSMEDLASASPSVMSEDVELVGGLLLRNLQVLQFNAHEVFELQCARPAAQAQSVIKHEGRSVFLAGAVFATLALFNHSCDPAVVRYFNGQHIVVRAVKNIKKGDEVSENYGPIFTTVPREQRRAVLKEQYWFDCDCVPCNQNWPLYSKMTENYMRFKCDSDRPCSNVVPVPPDSRDFMLQCGLCHQYTNILKGLKSLQDTDMLLRLAKAAMDGGSYGDALKKLIEVLQLYDATLVPPFASYYDCVQSLRRCMLSMGNYSITA